MIVSKGPSVAPAPRVGGSTAPAAAVPRYGGHREWQWHIYQATEDQTLPRASVDCGGWALEGATSDRSRCGVNIAASVNMVI